LKKYKICKLFLTSIATMSMGLALAQSEAELLNLDQTLWMQSTLLCAIELPVQQHVNVYSKCPVGLNCFPGEGREDKSQPVCGDGDMTLFNGLLCFSGIEDGCKAVEDAQNTTTGQWFRSPRLNTYQALRRTNSFSPDMALGVQIWAIAKPELARKRLQWWIDWLGRNQRCVGEGCTQREARFCADDDIGGDPEALAGCAFRVIDSAPLAATTQYFGIQITDTKLKQTLDRWLAGVIEYSYLDATITAPGFPQHLAASRILLLWNLGYNDPLLEKAASNLAQSQPLNPYFAWLNGASNDTVARLALSSCPKTTQAVALKQHRSDWMWQRKDGGSSSANSMIWDCRFIASILRNKKISRSKK
jgi:hypothetical protein